MFRIDEDLTINVTRGDTVFFAVSAEENGEEYTFKTGDVIRINVFEKKSCDVVVLQKDFPVEADTTLVNIILTTKETKIGEVISKPKDYWYEIELNPLTNPQTIVGYDDDGAKVFKLYPEGEETEGDGEGDGITEEDIPMVDAELDLTSVRPVQNQAIARAILKLKERSLLSIGNIEPESGLWFDTSAYSGDNILLQLSDDLSEEILIVDEDGGVYGVENATLNGNTTKGTYNFEII